MYPQFIAVGFTLYLNPQLKKICLFFKCLRSWKVKLLTPNSQRASKNREVVVGREKKKKERKKKADKSSPCWRKTLFGVLDEEKRADSRQPHREQRPDLPTALGPQHRAGTSQKPSPSNDGKTSHCNTGFPGLARHWFPYGEPQYSVLPDVLYQMCISGLALYMSVLTKSS